MATIEKISIALPADMVATLRNAVDTGEYASSSEVVRDALRDWSEKRSLRQHGVKHLRQLWRQALKHPSPGLPMEKTLSRLEKKYQSLAAAAKMKSKS